LTLQPAASSHRRSRALGDIYRLPALNELSMNTIVDIFGLLAVIGFTLPFFGLC
jgi:hypothetical protein